MGAGKNVVELLEQFLVGETGTLEAATAAPSRETRPWTRVPSIVKNRRPGLDMGEL